MEDGKHSPYSLLERRRGRGFGGEPGDLLLLLLRERHGAVFRLRYPGFDAQSATDPIPVNEKKEVYM